MAKTRHTAATPANAPRGRCKFTRRQRREAYRLGWRRVSIGQRSLTAGDMAHGWLHAMDRMLGALDGANPARDPAATPGTYGAIEHYTLVNRWEPGEDGEPKLVSSKVYGPR